MNKYFLRRALSVTVVLALAVPFIALAEEAEDDSPVYRALLIACDEFVDAANMTPIGENNLSNMETMLQQDVRGFEIKRQYGITSSKESLAYAVNWAFGDATEQDVSLLYISTHGDFVTSHNNPYGVLMLSDGSLEDRITAQELNEILDRIPGTKVLLVDACNSGALIGKGVSPSVGSARVARTFQSSDYKVLTSSGASEPSWYLQPSLEHAPPGSSYFTTAMAVGAGLIGGYAADVNRDCTITLKEMYDYLWVNQASSAVQMYPQDDSFPLFVYDKGRLTEDAHGELTGFVFGSTALNQWKPMLKFGYTATVKTNVAYRITYLRNGIWDWINGETIIDETEFDGDMDPTGEVSPGRKEIFLDLSDVLPEGWTYAMIHIMTMGNAKEGRQPFIYASRVLRAKQTAEASDITVNTTLRWNLQTRRELEIFVRHAEPGSLTVSVYDAEGVLVRKLLTARTTRPQALEPDGSLLYWNGLNGKGEQVKPGKYEIRAELKTGKEIFQAETTLTIE